MDKAEKILCKVVRSGNGRSTVLQEQEDGTVALVFRRPIQREHVENGCLIQQNMVSRQGTKRVAIILLDDTSAEAAYQLLKSWREKRIRTMFLLSLFSRMFSNLERRPSMFRWFC
jgi:hypothetical protein